MRVVRPLFNPEAAGTSIDQSKIRVLPLEGIYPPSPSFKLPATGGSKAWQARLPTTNCGNQPRLLARPSAPGNPRRE
jgi:hypothetical protein